MASTVIVYSLKNSSMESFNNLDVALSDFIVSCENWPNWDLLYKITNFCLCFLITDAIIWLRLSVQGDLELCNSK